MSNLNKTNWKAIRSALKKAHSRYLFDPNVVFIDFGWRETRGKYIQNEPCIRIHVKNKIPRGSSMRRAQLEGITRGEFARFIGDYEIDVPQAKYRLNNRQMHSNYRRHQASELRVTRNSPLMGGISVSVGNRYVGNIAGTLGGLVKDRDTGDSMILSNFHVLANVWYAKKGWPIYQPGRGDGGSKTDKIGELSRHAMSANLDAAVANLTGAREIINQQLEIGAVDGTAWAEPGMEVIKSGRTTGITRGIVSGVEGIFKGYYNGVPRRIHNVMHILPRNGSEVSSGGDSGAFWLEEETRRAIGLHFAGQNHPEKALAMDMSPVLDALNVELL